ncbi:uncharacterized protein B0H18DRAFT_995145 [Fomitopsis serialis]|uniref:uncharacterized protein n=1 Tax=Fomitopsis serialis TaxID=139415 RepID=UPI002007560F|nr:uncharacterized protein B0H18DRAFT_995145 [Neoantrodia serialis]KAH9930081.1 hypothetical protein B0H18DRAFT_995145 [Neoantrodia serialis]
MRRTRSTAPLSTQSLSCKTSDTKSMRTHLPTLALRATACLLSPNVSTSPWTKPNSKNYSTGPCLESSTAPTSPRLISNSLDTSVITAPLHHAAACKTSLLDSKQSAGGLPPREPSVICSRPRKERNRTRASTRAPSNSALGGRSSSTSENPWTLCTRHMRHSAMGTPTRTGGRRRSSWRERSGHWKVRICCIPSTLTEVQWQWRVLPTYMMCCRRVIRSSSRRGDSSQHERAHDASRRAAYSGASRR